MKKKPLLLSCVFPIAFGLVTFWFTGCQERAFNNQGENPGTDSSESAVHALDERQIAGKLTANVNMESESSNGKVLCALKPQNVQIARFEKGKYKIYMEGRKPCNAGNSQSYRGWVPASAISYEESAFFGKLKEVQSNSAISVKMQYAGNKIFCTDGNCRIKEALYGKNRCFLVPEAAKLLQTAALALKKKNSDWKLALYDCYRPVYVQQRMFELVPDPRWVADPSPPRYGGHNRGIAIDLTIEASNGVAVDMGSGYDEFNSRSNFDFPGISETAKKNRKILQDVMLGAGFSPYTEEWWHFSLKVADDKPLDLAL